MDLREGINRLYQLLGKGKNDEFFNAVESDFFHLFDSNLKAQFISNASRYRRNEQLSQHALISRDEYNVEANKIVAAFTSILNKLADENAANAPTFINNSLYSRIDERQENWEVLERIAIDCAISGGTTAMAFYRDAWRTQADLSGDKRNPSTIADLEATMAMIYSLDTKLPGFARKLKANLTYFGEETAYGLAHEDENSFSLELKNRIKSDANFFNNKQNTIKVIFDAIDGTSSFTRGIPLFCSCLAVLVDNIPRVSAIYDPVHHVVYSAVLKGSNLEPASRSTASLWHVGIGVREDLKVKSEEKGKQNLASEPLGVHFTRSSANRNLLNEFVGLGQHKNTFQQLATTAKGIYALNSGVLAMTEVARGALGGFINIVTNLWDVAPGDVLIKAIGGKVTDYKNQEVDYSKAGKTSVVAAKTPGIHQEIFAAINH